MCTLDGESIRSLAAHSPKVHVLLDRVIRKWSLTRAIVREAERRSWASGVPFRDRMRPLYAKEINLELAMRDVEWAETQTEMGSTGAMSRAFLEPSFFIKKSTGAPKKHAPAKAKARGAVRDESSSGRGGSGSNSQSQRGQSQAPGHGHSHCRLATFGATAGSHKGQRRTKATEELLAASQEIGAETMKHKMQESAWHRNHDHDQVAALAEGSGGSGSTSPEQQYGARLGRLESRLEAIDSRMADKLDTLESLLRVHVIVSAEASFSKGRLNA